MIRAVSCTTAPNDAGDSGVRSGMGLMSMRSHWRGLAAGAALLALAACSGAGGGDDRADAGAHPDTGSHAGPDARRHRRRGPPGQAGELRPDDDADDHIAPIGTTRVDRRAARRDRAAPTPTSPRAPSRATIAPDGQGDAERCATATTCRRSRSRCEFYAHAATSPTSCASGSPSRCRRSSSRRTSRSTPPPGTAALNQIFLDNAFGNYRTSCAR